MDIQYAVGLESHAMSSPIEPAVIAPRRVHLTRMMSIWRSAGWPCRDPIEIDLLASRWVELRAGAAGHETLHLTEAGLEQLARARALRQRSNSAHDRLAERIARHLGATGRIVWRELSLRAKAEGVADAPAWRIARPGVYSIRNTTVEDYLQPMVHEVKVSRADLQSDLRHAAKRESYRWLASETYYVFPAGIATLAEIPDAYGVWLWHDDAANSDGGRLELARPARHTPCPLPFAVWMTLAKATPFAGDLEPPQGEL